MLLALDVGNTHTVVGYFDQDRMQNSWRISTHPLCTSDEFKFKLKMILSSSGVELDLIRSVAVSSVVPAFTKILQASFEPERLFIIDHQWPFSFEIKTELPQQVGADRLVNAEAAVRNYGAPCIVVDSGTATTLCAVSRSSSGRPLYLGGAIFAGMELSMQALTKNAAQLFSIELTPPQNAIGNSTQEALKSGMLLGYASMIDGMINRFKKELGAKEIPVICTGGISHVMKGLTSEITHFDADLTLKGIAYLHESFRKRQS